MRATTPRFLAAATLALLPFAACGDDGDDNGGGSDTTEPATPAEGAVEVGATDQLTFEPDSAEAEAGEVTFVLRQDSQLAHSLRIDGIDADEFRLEVPSTPGSTDTGSIELEAGEYEYFCDVPGHETVMRGVLTVTDAG